jgi:mannan endo-1,6-alpha-mannosidase
MRSVFNAIARVLAVIHAVAAVELSNVDDTDAVKSAASTIAERMVSYYHGNEPGLIPGELGDPYYWWECGAMFNSLINYWYYTGDTTYNKLVKDGMLFQVGPDNDYMVYDPP